MTKFHLYIDDSGTRDPDKRQNEQRKDGMDYFALGGIIIKDSDVEMLMQMHREFCKKWEIEYPLHSTEIRGPRGNFLWLGTDKRRADEFFANLEKFLFSLPIISIATIVHRPGYVARYKEMYADRLWLMCKTAFSILAERAAKYAQSQGAQLEIFFEQSGRREDRAIKQYCRSLKTAGMPFDAGSSGGYEALSAAEFKQIILGEPRERTKKTPMVQIADLMLYPIAKAGYEPDYPPYRRLFEQGKLIDALLENDERAALGTKYSCFDGA